LVPRIARNGQRTLLNGESPLSHAVGVHECLRPVDDRLGAEGARPARAAERQQVEAPPLGDHPLCECERLAQFGAVCLADGPGQTPRSGRPGGEILPLALIPRHLHRAVAVAGQDEALW